jgi:hypothetical protein
MPQKPLYRLQFQQVLVALPYPFEMPYLSLAGNLPAEVENISVVALTD